MASALDKSLEAARTKKSRTNIRSLVMYSGGLDSVALLAKVLAKVLAETIHHVHVHHIEIAHKEGRADAENRAVEKTLAFIRREYRDFDYSCSKNQFPLGLGGGADPQLALFTAGRVTTALKGMIDIVFTGHIQPPFWELNEGAAILNAVSIQRKQKPEWLWPFSQISGPFDMRKVHIWESIPLELAEMTWSCRRPSINEMGVTPCERCHACNNRHQLSGKLESRVHSWMLDEN